jgi:hypothetical protein
MGTVTSADQDFRQSGIPTRVVLDRLIVAIPRQHTPAQLLGRVENRSGGATGGRHVAVPGLSSRFEAWKAGTLPTELPTRGSRRKLPEDGAGISRSPLLPAAPLVDHVHRALATSSGECAGRAGRPLRRACPMRASPGGVRPSGSHSPWCLRTPGSQVWTGSRHQPAPTSCDSADAPAA